MLLNGVLQPFSWSHVLTKLESTLNILFIVRTFKYSIGPGISSYVRTMDFFSEQDVLPCIL